MFNRTIWLLFVIASVVLTACKKEKLMLSPSDALVKSKTEGNFTETYYYDTQKRLSKIVYSSPSSASYYHEFTYQANSISEYRSEEPLYALEQSLPNGATRINCTSNPGMLKLNEKGLYIGTASNCQTASYQYDANGFLLAQDFGITDYSIKEQFSNDRKNVLTVSGKGFNYLGGDFTENTTYLYYTDKLNSIGNKNFGKQYLGKSSENLMKAATKNGETTSYAYAFDAQERVIQKITTKGSTQTTTTYTYY